MEEKKISKKNLNFRRKLWLEHGHKGLYGDDGQMQCPDCGLDFKNDPLEKIYKVLMKKQSTSLKMPKAKGRNL